MAYTKKADTTVTTNVPGVSSAITEGLLYGINSSGQAVPADNVTGPVPAVGFAVKGINAAQATAGTPVALTDRGIVEFLTSEIAGGAFTVGATVFVGTSGGVTTTKPTTNTYLVQAIGTAISATKAVIKVVPGFIIAQTAGNSNVGI
jgi:hypothetical protein